VVGDPAIKDAVAFLVPAHSERTIRVNITAPESQIEKMTFWRRVCRPNAIGFSRAVGKSVLGQRKKKKYKDKKALA